MKLFDDITRTEQRPKRENEAVFAYCNISARRAVIAFRDLVEAWFQRYPQEVRKDLRARFRSPIDAQHRGAFFELYLHELLCSMGFECAIHPNMDRGTRTHPDFLISRNGQPCFYLEATSALPSQDETAKERMIAQLYDSLNKTESPNFFVAVELNGTPTTSPPGKRLRQELERWLSTLDPDDLRHRLETGGFDNLPSFEWSYQDWSISFLPIAKSSALRGKPGVRPIGTTLPTKAKAVDSHSSIHRAVIAKATKYGELALPFIVAVNVFDIFADSIDVMNALFGQEAVQVGRGPDGVLHNRLVRQPNGAWFGPRGPQNTRVSAALIALNLSPWAMASITPILIHHPWASKPIPLEIWPLAQQALNRETHYMEERPGKSVRDFIALPDPWPLPDDDTADSQI